MECANCGLCGNLTIGLTNTDSKKHFHFCDNACYFQFSRDRSKDLITENCVVSLSQIKKLKQLSAEFKKTKPNITENHKQWVECYLRLEFSKYMFFKSLLERKPRAELMKLQIVMKKALCESCEISSILKRDKESFECGEEFKYKWDNFIEAWCAPQRL